MTALPRFVVTASPHLKARATTPEIMWTVVGSLLPIVGAAVYFFGISALLVVIASTAGAVVTEAAFGTRRTLFDGSGTITGILLGLTLPPGLPLWMAFLGGAVAIALGKTIFGGLGYNIFNPALLGRAFLQAAFPLPMTTWRAPADIVTAATPLGAFKFEHIETPVTQLMLGTTGGSLGETADLVILACGAFLAWKRFLNWRTPASILGTVALMSFVLHRIDTKYPDPLFMLFSGGLMLGAVFMATDMVTSPVTNKGRWIFGFGVGVLVVTIRVWGGLPEGVMYSILLMNAIVPFINRSTQPRVFGTLRKEAA